MAKHRAFVVLAVLLYLTSAVVSQDPLRAQTVPSPTFANDTGSIQPNPFVNIPGWEQIVPGHTLWSSVQATLISYGYKIEPSQLDTDGVTQLYDVTINDPLHKIGISSNLTVIGAELGVTNDQIGYIDMGWSIQVSTSHLTVQDWQSVDPAILVQNYGSPDEVKFEMSVAGGGDNGNMILSWNHGTLVVVYNVNVTDENLDAVPVCFTMATVSSVAIFTRSRDSASAETLKNSLFVYTQQDFAPGMFIGIQDLPTLGQILARHECLQTPIEKWASLNPDGPTRVPAPTFTPTTYSISTPLNTDTPVSVTRTPTNSSVAPTDTLIPSAETLTSEPSTADVVDLTPTPTTNINSNGFQLICALRLNPSSDCRPGSILRHHLPTRRTDHRSRPI